MTDADDFNFVATDCPSAALHKFVNSAPSLRSDGFASDPRELGSPRRLLLLQLGWSR
jgi:hypothetical protein